MTSVDPGVGEIAHNHDHNPLSTSEIAKEDSGNQGSATEGAEISNHTVNSEVGDDANQVKKKLVVLVVSNRAKHKEGVLEFLMTDGTWKDPHETAAGVRIYECDSPLRQVLVETRPLKYIKNTSPHDTARQWISQNGLRRVTFGEDVVVVCVLPCTAGKPVSQAHTHRQQWMEVFKLIFGPLWEAVVILAKTEGETYIRRSTSDVEAFVDHYEFSKQNIIYSNMQEPGGGLETSIPLSSILSNGTLKPFPMPGDLANSVKRVWAPERVLLLGLTGRGKSTLAEVLTSGELNLANQKFAIGSGAKGVTKTIESGEGRGWFVVDTPGFGENQSGSVDEAEVKRMLNTYVALHDGTFAHYLFLTKRGRQDQNVRRIWKFLMIFFSDKVTRHFSVIVSNATDDWVDRNMADLQAAFPGCENFFTAKFPSIPADDLLSPEKRPTREEREQMLEMLKMSLQKLEDNLSKLGLVETETALGKWSTTNVQIESGRAKDDFSLKELKIIQLTDPIFDFIASTNQLFTRVRNILRLDNKTPLPPLDADQLLASLGPALVEGGLREPRT